MTLPNWFETPEEFFMSRTILITGGSGFIGSHTIFRTPVPGPYRCNWLWGGF
jgi:FlaA1/EpsC-like NDP-sugar epimerase